MRQLSPVRRLLFLLSLLVLPACSDSDQPQNPPANAAAPSADALPPDQVAAIFTALDQKDVEKASQLLKTNPKLIAAISDNGWPLLTVASANL